jgi:hypothetical protein
MQRLMTQAQYQLTLHLRRHEVNPPVGQVWDAALLQALADLLLGALGEEVEKRKSETGGIDEPEDHR